MTAAGVLIGAMALFALMRLIVEPNLTPGRQIWERVLGPEPADAAVLAGVRLAGTLSVLVGIGAAIGVGLAAWVESLDFADMGMARPQEAAARIEGALAVFDAGAFALSRLGFIVSAGYVVMFGAGLLYWSARSARNARAEAEAAIGDLREQGVGNRLPDLAPDERMRRVDEAIAGARMANAGGDIVEALYERRFRYDLMRRVDPALLREVGDRVPASRAVRALRFLISMPLVHNVKKAGSVVSGLAMVLVVPAALVMVSPGLREAMDEKRPALEELQAAVSLDLALSETPDSVPLAGEPEPDPPAPCGVAAADLTAEECDAAAEFGAAFEAAWGAELLERSGARAGAAEGIADARRSSARRAVLLKSVAPRAEKVFVAESAPSARTGEQWSRAVMDADLRARTGGGPVTGFGKRAAEIFGAARRMLFGAGETVVVEDRPLTMRELGATAMSAVTGHGADLAWPSGTEAGALQRILAGAAKGTLATGMETEARRERMRRSAELAALAETMAVLDARRAAGGRLIINSEAMRAAGLFVDPELARGQTEAIDRVGRLEFRGRRGGTDQSRVALGTVRRNQIDAGGVADALRRVDAAEGRSGMNTVESYSSVFPGIEGQAGLTDAARVGRILNEERALTLFGDPPEVWDGPAGGAGGPRGGPSPGGGGALRTVRATETTPIVEDRLRLARSFQRLRGYHGVGGVLIGREPDGEAAGLDLIDMDFRIEGREPRLTLTITHADGRKTVVGPYGAGVARLALAYAADGRPAAVTIIHAWPLREHKVLLHPALVDTVVGCHAIDVDLFVGKFLGRGSPAARVLAGAERSGPLANLYRRAWVERSLARLDEKARTNESGQGVAAGEEETIRIIRTRVAELRPAEEPETGMPLWSHVPAALKPLRDRPRVFDPKLVDAMESCAARSAEEGEGFEDCVVASAKRAGSDLNEEPTTAWEGVPIHSINTGVRERAYVLDPELEFAQPPVDVREGPLRFVAINSIPMRWVFGDPTELVDASQAWVVDGSEMLDKRVIAGALAERDALRTLRIMHEFTVAQRLFRAALDGRLGDRFPVERLVEVARETAKRVDLKAPSTERWLRLDGDENRLGAEGREAERDLREGLGVPLSTATENCTLSGTSSERF